MTQKKNPETTLQEIALELNSLSPHIFIIPQIFSERSRDSLGYDATMTDAFSCHSHAMGRGIGIALQRSKCTLTCSGDMVETRRGYAAIQRYRLI